MKNINTEYYTVETENETYKFETFWRACKIFHRLCDNHIHMVLMYKNIIKENNHNKFIIAVYNPETEHETTYIGM